MKFLYISLIFFVVSGKSFAVDCEKAITTIDTNKCAQIQQSKTDEELNVVYQRVLVMLDQTSKYPANGIGSDLKNGLIKAQRLWVKFREADCQNVYDFWSGGTIRGVMYSGCLQARAEQRIKELKEYEKTY